MSTEIKEKIVQYLIKIQSNRKTGSAYDQYDINLLWHLGKLIEELAGNEGNLPDTITSITEHASINGLKISPTLCKNAFRAKKIFPLENEYKDFAGSVRSYGKLREVLPLFDEDNGIPKEILKGLLNRLPTLTYNEAREGANDLKIKYCSDSLGVDIDALQEHLNDIISRLDAVIESDDHDFISDFRTDFPKENITKLRMMLSGLQREDIFQKYASQIKNYALPDNNKSNNEFCVLFSDVVNDIIKFRENKKARNHLIKKIGKALLGRMSTLLKAASDDDELRRYKNNKQVLAELLHKTTG